MPKPSESLKARRFEAEKTGTLIRWMTWEEWVKERPEIEAELNARFAAFDRAYFDSVNQQHAADLRERRGLRR